MEAWIKKILERERQVRGIPLEVKTIGRCHYLYMSTSVWDKGLKKRRKKTRYLGKINESGVVEKDVSGRDARSVFEYGNGRLAYSMMAELIPHLKRFFPDDYCEIIAMSIVKLFDSAPIRLVKSRWEKLYLSRELEASLSPNVLSEKLRQIGADVSGQKDFFNCLLEPGGVLAFDMSSVFSYSENLQLAERGYNSDGLYLKQINFVLLFSQDKRLPVMIKSLPGSVRELKTLKTTVNSLQIKNCILVLDRGFASYDTPKLLEDETASVVMPLRRNFKIIDYDTPLEESFIYSDRAIHYGSKTIGKNTLYLFEDVKMRAEEETNFVKLVEEGKKKRSDLEAERKKFGRIAILTNTKENGKSVYQMYKGRQSIETAFDAIKNELENDKTYLANDDAIRGYFFLSFITLYLYCRILELLRKKDLVGKTSVRELLFELSKVYMITYKDDRKALTEIPAKVEKLEKELDLNLFPKP